jgi:hypothetical protein
MIITRTVLLASCAFIACGGAARAMSPETTSTSHSPMTQATGETSTKMAGVSHEMMGSVKDPMTPSSMHSNSETVHQPMLTPDTSDGHTTQGTHEDKPQH